MCHNLKVHRERDGIRYTLSPLTERWMALRAMLDDSKTARPLLRESRVIRWYVTLVRRLRFMLTKASRAARDSRRCFFFSFLDNWLSSPFGMVLRTKLGMRLGMRLGALVLLLGFVF